jgi:hypothetical protein
MKAYALKRKSDNTEISFTHAENREQAIRVFQEKSYRCDGTTQDHPHYVEEKPPNRLAPSEMQKVPHLDLYARPEDIHRVCKPMKNLLETLGNQDTNCVLTVAMLIPILEEAIERENGTYGITPRDEIIRDYSELPDFQWGPTMIAPEGWRWDSDDCGIWYLRTDAPYDVIYESRVTKPKPLTRDEAIEFCRSMVVGFMEEKTPDSHCPGGWQWVKRRHKEGFFLRRKGHQKIVQQNVYPAPPSPAVVPSVGYGEAIVWMQEESNSTSWGAGLTPPGWGWVSPSGKADSDCTMYRPGYAALYYKDVWPEPAQPTEPNTAYVYVIADTFQRAAYAAYQHGLTSWTHVTCGMPMDSSCAFIDGGGRDYVVKHAHKLGLTEIL